MRARAFALTFALVAALLAASSPALAKRTGARVYRPLRAFGFVSGYPARRVANSKPDAFTTYMFSHSHGCR